MKISFNWLKKYIYVHLNAEKISDYLTELGLNVKNIIKNTEIEDYLLDLEITPNRSDAMSYYGIARDLYAFLKFRGYKTNLIKPKINNFSKKNINKYSFKIFFEKNNECKRYSGLILSKIKIEKSPSWIHKRLKSIGIKPVNNIIDIIHFVTFELGIPIHVFDADKIEGNTFLIKNGQKNLFFNSEDNRKRELSKKDLIIYDQKKPLSIAGIINNIDLNINTKTKNIFLGSVYFNPTYIRNIGIRHMINTNSRFRLERGIDPNMIVKALQRTYTLIKQITNCQIRSDIVDFYPCPINHCKIELRYSKIKDILGKTISNRKIKKILFLLEIIILSEKNKSLLVLVPPYRIDVQREIDLIEEILRIYGLEKIRISNKKQKYPIPTNNYLYKTEEEIQKIIFSQLVNYGFQEIINSPIIRTSKNTSLLNKFLHIEEIKILNSINKYDNKSMRSSLLFGFLDCIKFNSYREKENEKMKFFEIGKIYYKNNSQLLEKTFLSIAISEKIKKNEKIYNFSSFFDLKGVIEQIFQRIGIQNYTQINSFHPFLIKSIFIRYKNKNLIELGKLKENISDNKNIFYAEIDWEYLISIIQKNKIIFIPYSKYPISKRDLSILVDKSITFEMIHQFIKKEEKDLIKKIKIYDFYEGKNLPKEKKSYTISFFFESNVGTLTDITIHKIMKKIENLLKDKLGAKIRDINLIY
ncbi:phenylalanine--tRNA ligase subunit beta [Blattabacterium cuenoti]|uniref:phenylalanine--tRNA ligase subunit beta n=1 Tax=Blattabacterium cuenoti TaxID=1653831 RepID=UPI00163BE29D|nr:phenylalanine--tRNA ligase subunit beta [Blattabacterium cuenoti]